MSDFSYNPDELAGRGEAMYSLVRRLYPICRSITGDGVRQTLGILGENLDLEMHETPSGLKVFDWETPPEWNIRDAYVIGPDGDKVIDFKRSNLSVMGYSVPVNAVMSLEELRPHLHTLPEQPKAIPYVTSYYHRNWGFCLPHEQYLRLAPGQYRAVIDSSLAPGALTHAEYLAPGKSAGEILISCYTCHPSLCNDNLSGVVAAAALAEMLTGFELEHSYRFLFIPETIGSITWLWLNRDRAADIKCGLVLTCLGDAGGATYQKTWQGGRDLDRAALLALRDAGGPFTVRDFRPAGSDERQFSSPGFRIPMGVLMRSPYLEFAQYHTSADDLSFVSPEKLADSLGICLAIIYILEHNAFYQSLNPHCEPQLSRRGLYRSLGRGEMESEALFWLLNYCDGDHDLADIARRSGLGFREIKQGADLLRDHGLLELKQTADPGSGNSRRLENDHEDHNPGR